MTVTPIIGQDIGAASRATRRVLQIILDRDGTPFDEWVTLRGLATADAPVAGDELRRTLAAGGVDGDTAIDALVRSGDLSQVGTAVVLTPAGDARYRALERQVVEVVSALYDGIPAADMATTKRVLGELTEKASHYAA
jgi:hypothetical protein